MTQQEVFNRAVWLEHAGRTTVTSGTKSKSLPCFPILRSSFSVSGVKKAVLRVVGLGFFHCFINGKRVGDDLFLPLSTDFEPRPNFPTEEILSGHRLYVPEYDVTGLLADGLNTLAVHFGGGWYTFEDAKYGDPKVIWRLFGETSEGREFDFASSENDRIGDSFVKDRYFPKFEAQDFLDDAPEALLPDFDDSAWKRAKISPAPETEYLFSDCPADRVCERLSPRCIDRSSAEATYDCGKNTTGYPVLKLRARRGEKIEVRFSEELEPDGTINARHGYGQSFTVVSDGSERTVKPQFTWFGFRYFSVTGFADVECVEVVRCGVEIAAGFESDSELLNWIHDTYLNTQLTNMHAGIPSDCPHIERRGYTGDGQLTCHAAMDMLNAKEFYKKWIYDIIDCQDKLTGHVQYTAPYTRCGGGPGGWGCAIVEVPYQYYMHYGDDSVLYDAYPGMLRYFDYLEAHSDGKLVVSDKKGEWCLGDWCPPIQVVLPAPFINNYFYVKSLLRAITIAKRIGREDDVPELERRAAERKAAVVSAYYNSWDGNFVGNLQGANAFAVDIGLGDDRTYKNLAARYKALGRYDTGIFGTDVVTRVLFEHGDGRTALGLLLSGHPTSFDGMRRAGATTLWEYWPGSLCDRSHNHPMFGAVSAYLYDYLLGIRAKDGSAAYREVEIAPVLADGLDRVCGWRMLPGGKISVSMEKDSEKVSFAVTIPPRQSAVFSFGGKTHPLSPGENLFTFPL
ncbi:MAG: family 78 glycoside hydrolase catalytic domain [Clostridiales bacterium]|nr:family 78 glycoside hydrolase catalytic domain [Clostridiales bacterium]